MVTRRISHPQSIANRSTNNSRSAVTAEEKDHMGQEEALKVVEEYKQLHGHAGTLEALIAMRDDELLSPRERTGFNVAFNGFRRLFYGDES